MGVDLSSQMLAKAQERAHKKGLAERIAFCCSDILALDLPPGRFDVITCAFGVRNFADRGAALEHMTRLLSPGGALFILELSVPQNALVRTGYRLYAHKLIPALGALVAGRKGAYTYLPHSIDLAPQGVQMQQMMQQAGLERTSYQTLTGGVVTLYRGFAASRPQ